jgi:ABC-type bacteriocin/lantibiotic exporter with double-glycine peptidase domain
MGFMGKLEFTGKRRFSFGLWAAPLILSLLGAGCAATSPVKLSDGNSFSSEAVLTNVPFKLQKDPNLCGLAVLEMLTLYYDKPLSPEKVQWLADQASQNKALSGETLTAALGADYYTAIFAGTLDEKETGLYHHLDLHRPLVVMMASEDGKTNHYELVAGYDPRTSLLSVLDPARGPLALPLANFKAAWRRANYFTLLAVPESKDPENKGEILPSKSEEDQP